MNPYQSPKNSSQGVPSKEALLYVGKPCCKCGSLKTKGDSLMSARPSVLMVMLFGWLPLLVRSAFVRKCCRCTECGALTYYKTAGSWLALAVLCLLVLLIVLSATVEGF